MAPEDQSRKQDREERATILARCVSDTVQFINSRSVAAVESHPAAGILLANSYFLVSDAYKRCRGLHESRTHPYKVAAFTAATIMATRPIRILNSANVVSMRVAFANQQCAMRAAQGLLGLDLEMFDNDFIRRLYSSVLEPIELPCLTPYLTAFESAFSTAAPITFKDLEQAINFDSHNVLNFSTPELQTLESLITQFITLEGAAGHPFIRILSGWRRWWSGLHPVPQTPS
jgi:hypothetical protein